MALDHPKVFRPFALAGLLGLAALASAPRARAQDHTPDPYKPYNSAYDSFTFPQYPNNSGLLPGQSVLEGRAGYSGANRFEEYIDGGDYNGDVPYGRRRTGPGVPYYSSYRRYDADYGRVYQPNRAADEDYYRDQQTKRDKYVEYLREQDPRRKAELLREYTQETRKLNSGLSATRNTLARSGATAKGGASTRTNSAPGLDRGAAPTPGTGRNFPGASGRSSAPAPRRSLTGSSVLDNPRSGLFPDRSTRSQTPADTLKRSEEMDAVDRPRTRTAPGLGGPRRTSPR